jgi:DDE superfamily endonuclease
MRDWVATQQAWLTVERLPAYAPELNPVEGLWANLKGVELANFAGEELVEVADAAEHGIHRVCGDQQLAWSFLAHTGLTLDHETPHNLRKTQ